MRNLILLFVKNGGLFTFLFLEGLCMFLIVQYNRKQNEIYFSSANTITGAVYSQFDELVKYYNLSSVADSLARENARLYSELDQMRMIRSPWRDTAKNQINEALYTFIPAKVRNNSISGYNNHLTIDVGSEHGVESGMGVIGNSGIVGIVRSTSKNYAHVISVLNKVSRISVAIKRNGHFGFLVWQGSNPLKATVVDVPKHVDLVKGDTIQTSGFSTIFPGGVMVGIIDDFVLEPGSNSYTIDVQLSNDLSRVKYVYVVDHLLEEELDKLEEEVENE
ncbi:MAG: rod shape-determining protein MreC [Bacteroidota bacterium]